MRNSKKLEDANRGDLLVYQQAIGLRGSVVMAKADLIPVGSILEIDDVYKRRDGLCMIKVSGIYVLDAYNLIIIDNYNTYKYKEFIILDKSNKSTIKILYDF